MILFPSPCRGLIFLTFIRFNTCFTWYWFPSPCRGLIFLTDKLGISRQALNQFPSPCRGLIFLTSYKKHQWRNWQVSVPLQGTYLPYPGCVFATFLASLVSVPLQGTYLPYIIARIPFTNLSEGFRPLAGDLSSLRRTGIWTNIRSKNVSVPLQGTYLPYLRRPEMERKWINYCFRPLAGDLSSLR